MTYEDLVGIISDFVESDEQSFVEKIPLFISLAEERIYRMAKIPGVRDRQLGTLSIGFSEFSAPDDFISTDSFEVNADGVWMHLMPKDQDFLSEAYPNDPVGLPVHYAQVDDATILLMPRPSEPFAYRLTYVRKPQPISSGAENWIMKNAQQAIIYGSLVEAYTYLKGEEDLLALYTQRFMDAIGQARIVANGDTRTNEWRDPAPIGR